MSRVPSAVCTVGLRSGACVQYYSTQNGDAGELLLCKTFARRARFLGLFKTGFGARNERLHQQENSGLVVFSPNDHVTVRKRRAPQATSVSRGRGAQGCMCNTCRVFYNNCTNIMLNLFRVAAVAAAPCTAQTRVV